MVNDLYSALPNDCAYIFLLFINVPDLEPDIFLGQRPRWISHYVFETLVRELVEERISKSGDVVTSKLDWNFCCCL